MNEEQKKLAELVRVSLGTGAVPTEELIFTTLSKVCTIGIVSVNDDEAVEVLRFLRENMRIDMGFGASVDAGYEPWLNAAKASLDFYYWERYRRLLIHQSIPPLVVSSLDRVTDSVLDRIGNPTSDSGWPRRGLVMGDVQSGKTSNYTGLICKAADAGYKLIILLTGTLENLRRQTQGRLDQGFVGLDSSGLLDVNRKTTAVGVGLIDSNRAAAVFTSTKSDFSVGVANALGLRLDALKEPVLLVVKKNKRILENLSDWLRDHNAGADGRIYEPMLLIDDEADSASVNTNLEKATAINSAIRTLLQVFPKSSYVGFTATPFANIFISPDLAHPEKDSRENLLGDDLFPRNFIYTLDPPTNYFGSTTLFGGDETHPSIQVVKDKSLVFPERHKPDLRVANLPDSLLEAVRSFFLATTLMDARPLELKHRSMLVNVSPYTAVQNQVRDLIDEYVRTMQSDCRNYAGLGPGEADKIPNLAALHRTFDKLFERAGRP